MPFVKGISGNPGGKPSGAADKRSVWKKYVDPEIPELLKVGMQMAKEGCTPMLQLFLARALPQLPKTELDEKLVEAQIQMLEARTAELTEIRVELDEIKVAIRNQQYLLDNTHPILDNTRSEPVTELDSVTELQKHDSEV